MPFTGVGLIQGSVGRDYRLRPRGPCNQWVGVPRALQVNDRNSVSAEAQQMNR